MFCVLVLWPGGTWDLSFPTRDRILPPALATQQFYCYKFINFENSNGKLATKSAHFIKGSFLGRAENVKAYVSVCTSL